MMNLYWELFRWLCGTEKNNIIKNYLLFFEDDCRWNLIVERLIHPEALENMGK